VNRFPYPTDPIKAFGAMEADALMLERKACEMEASATAIEKMPSGSKLAARRLRADAASYRRIISFLGLMSGRMSNFHKLYEPVTYRRDSSYGGSPDL